MPATTPHTTKPTYRASFSYSHGWSVYETSNGAASYLEPVASGYASLEDAQQEARRLNLGDGYGPKVRFLSRGHANDTN